MLVNTFDTVKIHLFFSGKTVIQDLRSHQWQDIISQILVQSRRYVFLY